MEEKVKILYSRSAYGSDKPHMSKEKNDVFKYPCIDNINTKLEIGKLYYSSTNKNGHFGIPKVIVGAFGVNPFIDMDGKYGLTHHAIGIIDDKENLNLIKEVLLSDKFKKFNAMLNFGGIKDIPLSHKIISMFRNDFWKEFI